MYPRGRCYPASHAFAGEPDIVGRATGLRQVPDGAGYLYRRLTLVTRDRSHPNADDLEIVGGMHAHFPALSLISRSREPSEDPVRPPAEQVVLRNGHCAGEARADLRARDHATTLRHEQGLIGREDRVRG
jgi:hypothetical protein